MLRDCQNYQATGYRSKHREATKTLRGYQTSRILANKESVLARTRCDLLMKAQLEARQSLHIYQSEELNGVILEGQARKEEERRRER